MIEQIAEERYPATYEEEGIRFDSPNYKQLRAAFISGYNAANEWVSVEDRLPETNPKWDAPDFHVPLLIFYDGHIYMGSYSNLDGRLPFFSISFIHSKDSLPVTHWMPLPTPPKQL